MTIVLYLAITAFVFFLMYATFARKRSAHVQGILEDVNVQALSNLMDPAEQEYLSRKLPPRDYRQIHRRRMRVALAYLRELEHALPSAADASSHSALSRARLLILELRWRVIVSYILPNVKVNTADLIQVVAQLAPTR